MSTLLARASRAPAPVRPAGRGDLRVDERLLLNRPQFGAAELVRVFVEDTSGREHRPGRTPPSPRLGLRIADHANLIALEFSVESAERRENSLYKIDTLLGALHHFRAGLEAEIELYASRELGTAPQRIFDVARLAL